MSSREIIIVSHWTLVVLFLHNVRRRGHYSVYPVEGRCERTVELLQPHLINEYMLRKISYKEQPLSKKSFLVYLYSYSNVHCKSKGLNVGCRK